MRITVEFHGLLRPLAGTLSRELDFPGSTVAEALECLCTELPQLRAQLPRIACALDDELATPEQPLADSKVLALIPPVSGGSP